MFVREKEEVPLYCPYKDEHDTYTADTVELYNEIIPDYASRQFHVLSYYYCTNCGLAWDINDTYNL